MPTGLLCTIPNLCDLQTKHVMPNSFVRMLGESRVIVLLTILTHLLHDLLIGYLWSKVWVKDIFLTEIVQHHEDHEDHDISNQYKSERILPEMLWWTGLPGLLADP
eukprot:TRINITY_DN12043_c0_g1_i2.p1 TRINITY_DN12043_c0_g1~~TRINITY_DN12043_c0_g1_i2.p1  ORF type:complete len:106 (-),score=7.75 TRINITY_DN12043_c0_g1_i2:417-734(-)